MKKGKPATLTSSLLARKGEAEPARLADGTVPKDVMALHEEIVARVAADISRGTAPQMSPVSTRDEVSGSDAALPDSTLDAAQDNEPEIAVALAGDVPQAQDGLTSEPEAEDAAAATATQDEAQPDDEDEERPVYDGAASDGRVTLSDWAAPAGSGQTDTGQPNTGQLNTGLADAAPGNTEIVAKAEDRPPATPRSGLMPAALGIGVAVIVSAWAIWHLTGRDQPIADQAQTEAPAGVAPALPEPPQAPAAAPSTLTQAAAKPPAAAPKPEAPKPEAPKAEAVKSSVPKAAPAKPAPGKSGNYAAQLLSAKSEASAQQQWGTLAARFPALVAGHTHTIQRADLGAKGIYYRVKLTGLSAADARAACQSFAAEGQDCLVVKK